MAFHRWASDGSAGLSRHVRASILRQAAAKAPRISRRTTIQVIGGFLLPPSPAASTTVPGRAPDGSGFTCREGRLPCPAHLPGAQWVPEDGLEPGTRLFGRPSRSRWMPCDLRFSLRAADRSCPPTTSGLRCRADPARTRATTITASSGPSVRGRLRHSVLRDRDGIGLPCPVGRFCPGRVWRVGRWSALAGSRLRKVRLW